MVTLDKIVENVGKFNGNVSESNKIYEKAKANVELLETDKGMKKLEENLKKATGYDDFILPWKPSEYSIILGDIQFNVRSETTTKRPQYKSAVEQMENYLNGINKMLSENRIITGVAKSEDKIWGISVDSLLENYTVIISGIKYPGIKQVIKYDTEGIAVPKMMNVSKENDGSLTDENFRDYVLKDDLLKISKKYVKAYEKALGSHEKIGSVIPVTSKKAYEEKPIKSEGVDWAYVAKILVNDDPKAPGELNILANPELSFEERISMMPYYDLFLREPMINNVPLKKLYIGILSVHDRIQNLKGERTITRKGATYSPKAIV